MSELVHGYGAYSRGVCKCEVCTTAKREYERKARARRLASGDLTHGTRTGYDAGCRCDECLLMKAVAYRTSLAEYKALRIRPARLQALAKRTGRLA